MHSAIRSVALLVLLSGCSNTPDSDIALEYEAYELSNGLSVILHVDRSDPMAAVSMTFHAGSSREVEGKTGFAHLFEHLFFLDSENVGQGGLDRLMTRIGSSTNGSTSRDRTNYFEVVPIDGLQKALWAESDKLGFFINTVTEDVLAKEKQVVKNEKRQSVDNRPYGHTNYVIDRALYPEGHPYRWQVIGSLQDLDAATLPDVRAFHGTWYGPNNATLVVAGDLDVEQTRAWIDYYFGEIPRAEMPDRPAIPAVQLDGPRSLVHEDRFARLPALTMAWPTVPQFHPDEPALDMLADLLTDGKSAPFYKVLVEELELAPSARAFQSGSELAGRFSLSVRAFGGVDLDSVAVAVDRAFTRFEEEGISTEQMGRLKTARETGFYNRLSSVLGKAFSLAQYSIFAGSPGFAQEDLRRALAVTEADVIRVYQEYIKDRAYIATSFVPAGAADLALSGSETAEVYEEPIVDGREAPVQVLDRGTIPLTPTGIDRSVEPPFGDPPSLTPPAVWRAQTDLGMDLLGIEDRELPIVQFQLGMRGGKLLEDPSRVGVSNLLAETMLEGTANRTAEELELAIDLLGASIRVSAGSQSFAISGSTLARNFDETMALVHEILTQPRWDADAFERARQRVGATLRSRQGEPTSIAGREFSRLVYGDHILATDLLGTPESVQAITLDDLKAWHQSALRPNAASLLVAGAVTQAETVAAAVRFNQGWTEGEIVLPAPPQWDAGRAGLYFVDVPGAAQSVVQIGRLALAQSDDEYLPANFTNFKLGGGGFAAELTQQLREGKGYTYGIFSGFSGTDLAGPFQINSSVRSNITFEALQLIKQIVENHGPGFDEARLDETRNFLLRNNASRFETLGAKLGMLFAIQNYDFPVDYVVGQEEVVRSMTVEKVKEIAEEYLDTGQFVWLVVGDAQTQLGRLEELGLGEPQVITP